MDARTLCLGALQFGDASGYEIKKMYEDGMLGHLHAASFGSIYPALTRLEAEGLATSVAMAQEKRPDKKVYRLTESGRAALIEALLTPPGPDRMRSDFLFILVLGHLLPAGLVQRLIDQRIAWYRDCIQNMESCTNDDRPASVKFVNDLGLAVYRTAVGFLEERRHELVEEPPAPRASVAE